MSRIALAVATSWFLVGCSEPASQADAGEDVPYRPDVSAERSPAGDETPEQETRPDGGLESAAAARRGRGVLSLESKPSFVPRVLPYGVVSPGDGMVSPEMRTDLSLAHGEQSISVHAPEDLVALLDPMEIYWFHLQRDEREGFRLLRVEKDGDTVYPEGDDERRQPDATVGTDGSPVVPLSEIVIPEAEEFDFFQESAEYSATSKERREMISGRIAAEFARADQVLVVSLEPTSRSSLREFQLAKLRKLRPGLIGGYSYYGSVALEPEAIATFADAVQAEVEHPVTPRLGFCWSPRHAIVLRSSTAPDFVILVCYECGGMRFEDGGETLTFCPPRGLEEEMDRRFKAHHVPCTEPFKESTGHRASTPSAPAPAGRSVGGENSEPGAKSGEVSRQTR